MPGKLSHHPFQGFAGEINPHIDIGLYGGTTFLPLFTHLNLLSGHYREVRQEVRERGRIYQRLVLRPPQSPYWREIWEIAWGAVALRFEALVEQQFLEGNNSRKPFSYYFERAYARWQDSAPIDQALLLPPEVRERLIVVAVNGWDVANYCDWLADAYKIFCGMYGVDHFLPFGSMTSVDQIVDEMERRYQKIPPGAKPFVVIMGMSAAGEAAIRVEQVWRERTGVATDFLVLGDPRNLLLPHGGLKVLDDTRFVYTFMVGSKAKTATGEWLVQRQSARR